jgi:DNA-binding response OmpR family regulator
MLKTISVVKDRLIQEQLCSVLSTEKIAIAEVESPGDLALFEDVDLLFIDEQLLQESGLELVLQLQQRPESTRIIYLCLSWCDVDTFVWLRDILGVSMVVMLPINPQVLVERLKKILGSENGESVVETGLDTVNGDSVSASQSELDTGNKKLMLQQAIIETQKRLRLEVVKEWETLALLVRQLFDENDSGQKQIVIRAAHKLKGSAGSLTLPFVSDCAGKIEIYLQSFNPQSIAARKLWESEILRQLEFGRNALCRVESRQRPSAERADGSFAPTSKILLVGARDRDLLMLERVFADCRSELVYLDDSIKIVEALESVVPELIAFGGEQRFLSLYDICRRIHDDARWNQLPVLFIHSASGISYGDSEIPEVVRSFSSSKRFTSSEVTKLVDAAC